MFPCPHPERTVLYWVLKDGTFKDAPCIVFKVTNEEGKTVGKEYSVSSRKLVNKLEPIVMKGFPITIKITSYGIGFDTKHEAKEIKQ